MNCGLDLDSVRFKWKTYDVSFTEFLTGSPSSHWNNMMNNVKADKGNYDLTIVADGLSYVIHLVHAE